MAIYNITTSAASFNFDTQIANYHSCCKIDTNHFVDFYSGIGDDGFAQVFTVNTSTWAITTSSASLEFDTQQGTRNSACQIDVNHFVNFWSSVGDDGFTQVFTVNTSTFAITTASASLEFDTQYGSYNSCFKIDTNHVVNVWGGYLGYGWAQVFAINTSTWAITTAASALNFEGSNCSDNSACLIDSTHFVDFYSGPSSKGAAQVFTVNTSTWDITTSSARLDFYTADYVYYNSCFKIDANHVINVWNEFGGSGRAQVFTINTSTWAITTANDPLQFEAWSGKYLSCYQVDSNHFVTFYQGTNNDGFAQVFTVNTSTWAITTSSASLEFDTQNSFWNSCFQIDSGHYINLWGGGSSGESGYAQTFTIEMPPTFPITYGSSAELYNGNPSITNGFKLNSTQAVVLYGHATNVLHAKIADISGSTITFGTEADIATGSNSVTGCRMSDTTFVVAWYDGSVTKTAVCSVSGTTITVNSSNDMTEGGQNIYISPLDSSKFVITYNISSTESKVRVGTVSGTSVSYGTAVSIGTNYNVPKGLAAFSASKFVILSRDGLGSTAMSYIVGDISGTTITLGTITEVLAGNTQVPNTSAGYINPIVCFSSTKCAFVYGTDTPIGSMIVGDVSGTTITWGTGKDIVGTIGNSQSMSIAYLSATECIVSYQLNSTNLTGESKYVSISGTTPIADSSPSQFNSAKTSFNSIVGMSALKVFVSYNDTTNSKGYAKIGDLPQVTNIKSYNTNLKANIKSINTNPIANVKSLNTNV